MHLRVLTFILLIFNALAVKSQTKTLIVDGQNNHDHWPKITYMMRTYLENSGLFKVDVMRTRYTWNGKKFVGDYKISGVPETEDLDKPKADPGFSPDFQKYDLVVINFGWNAALWPEQTQKNFENFVKKGGGVVIVHAADNSFPEWPAYNEMIGLGGWGDRNEKDGPYVYYDEHSVLRRDQSPGPGGSHGPQHEFQITVRDRQHPITQGMPTVWLHSVDELYDRLRGPAKNMKVLATAYSATEKQGTGRHEPMLFTINYGKGRIFHTPMGHMDKSWECVGLITSFLRGAEWAATGKVTQAIPEDFPQEDQTRSRPFK